MVETVRIRGGQGDLAATFVAQADRDAGEPRLTAVSHAIVVEVVPDFVADAVGQPGVDRRIEQVDGDIEELGLTAGRIRVAVERVIGARVHEGERVLERTHEPEMPGPFLGPQEVVATGVGRSGPFGTLSASS